MEMGNHALVSIASILVSVLSGHHTFISLFFLDIDECEMETASCDMNAECTNTDGSYTCSCLAGYSGDGLSTCMVYLCSQAWDKMCE